MKHLLLAALIAAVVSCVPVEAQEVEAPLYDDAVYLVVGVDYVNTCRREGYYMAMDKMGEQLLLSYQLMSESKYLYNNLTPQQKQDYANAMWEMESVSYSSGCHLYLEFTPEMGKHVMFVDNM